MQVNWRMDLGLKQGILRLEGLEYDDSVYVYWGNKDCKTELVDEIPLPQLAKAIATLQGLMEAIDYAKDEDD